MAKLFFVLFLLLSSTSVVADCQFFDGTKSLKVLEGQAVSLRSPGKSLEKLKIQDQDGLNTCYANTTSVILKSILPNQPDVSYTHAAVMGTTRGWEEDWSTPNNVYLNKENKNDDFTSYGWICDTIAGLKNAGGACPKNLSAAEGPQIWDSDIQQRLFHGLSLYFDNLNKMKASPEAMALLKKDLSLAIEAINVESALLVQQCEDRKSSKFPTFGAVKNLLEETMYDQISDPSLCNQARVAEIKKLVTTESKMEKDRFDLIPNPETLSKFQSIMENDPLIAKDLDSFLNTTNASLSKYPELVQNFGKKFDVLLKELIPDDVIRIVCKDLPVGQSPLVKKNIEAQAKTFLYAMEYNKNNPCKDLLHSNDLDNLLNSRKNPKACLAPTNVDMILAAMKPLIEIETSINESLLPTLLNPEARYADQIVRAIMPGCLDQSKLISVKNLACATFPVCDSSGGFNDAFTYDGPKDGCHSLDVAKKMVRTKTLNGINQGRALGIGVCTAFLNNPDIKSNFCQDGLPEGKKHSLHEMTVTGYRCKSGQIEYEIVNSWGSRCTDNRNVECQKDADENPTGPFWVKEEAMVDNTTDISAVTVKKK